MILTTNQEEREILATSLNAAGILWESLGKSLKEEDRAKDYERKANICFEVESLLRNFGVVEIR